jgi:hypothetical protein
LYLFGLGCAVSAFRDKSGDILEQVALAVAAGMLINLSLMLTGQPILHVFVVGGGLAAWGVWKAVNQWRSRPATIGRQRAALLGSGCCIVYVLVVYYFDILSEPLAHWDARSIWFFHARMIYVEGALRHAGWNHPSIAFSSPDYPKLIPAMAAQLAYLKGFWNEFLPKGSLLVLLTPAVFWAFSFRSWTASFALLIVMLFLGQYEWLSNGYMDAYLVIYSALALLFMGRYLVEGRDFDLHSAFLSVGIVTSLKNEGLLFALCLVAALGIATKGFTKDGLTNAATRLLAQRGYLAVLLIAVAPTVLWSVYKWTWGLQNELTRQPLGALSRVATRVFDGPSVGYVLHYMAIEANGLWVPAGLVAITLFFSTRLRVRVHPGALVAAWMALLHFCGIGLVYLSTPSTLQFHLTTSAPRTMASTRIAFLVSMYFLLATFEAMDRDLSPRVLDEDAASASRSMSVS